MTLLEYTSNTMDSLVDKAIISSFKALIELAKPIIMAKLDFLLDNPTATLI